MESSRSMAGRVCVVTGATSGIGRETALGLARLGATVVAVARDRARGEAVVREVSALTGNPSVELLVADLAAQASIRQAAAELKRRYRALHVLVNQAGLVMTERVLTADGVETTFAVNHLAYFLLTNLLLEELEAGAPSRVVNGTGGIYAAGRVDLDDLTGARNFSGFRALAQAKLANVLFTYELARRLEGKGVTVNCFHPGGVKTNLGRDASGFLGLFMRVGRLFFADADKGAEPAIFLASSPELEGVTGRYFDRKKPVARTGGSSNDSDLARRLWDVSAELTGLAPTAPSAAA